MPESVRFYGGFLQWMGFNDRFVDVKHAERLAGTSSYSLRRLLRFSVNLILSYSDKPLRLCMMAGFSMAAASALIGALLLVRALVHGYAVAGWASIVVSLFFTTGSIIFALGVVGIYVGRVLREVKRRPHFVVRSRTPAR
jgi:dolichol-phosphate mannosyltransferase